MQRKILGSFILAFAIFSQTNAGLFGGGGGGLLGSLIGPSHNPHNQIVTSIGQPSQSRIVYSGHSGHDGGFFGNAGGLLGNLVGSAGNLVGTAGNLVGSAGNILFGLTQSLLDVASFISGTYGFSTQEVQYSLGYLAQHNLLDANAKVGSNGQLILHGEIPMFLRAYVHGQSFDFVRALREGAFDSVINTEVLGNNGPVVLNSNNLAVLTDKISKYLQIDSNAVGQYLSVQLNSGSPKIYQIKNGCLYLLTKECPDTLKSYYDAVIGGINLSKASKDGTLTSIFSTVTTGQFTPSAQSPQSGSPGQTFPIGGQVSWQQSQSPLTSSPSMQQPGKTASTSTVITTSNTNNGQFSPSDQSPQSGSPGQTFPIGGQVSWQQSQSPLTSSPSMQQPGKTASTSTVVTTSNTNNGQFSPSTQSPQSVSPGQTFPIGGQVSWQQSQSPLTSSPSMQQPGKTASTSTVVTTSNTNNGQLSPSDQSPQSGSPGQTFPIGGQVSWQQSQSPLISSPSIQQQGKTTSTSTVITTSNTSNGQFSPSDQSPQSGSPGQTFPIGGQVSWQQSQSPLISSPSMQQPGKTASTSTVVTTSNTNNGQFSPSTPSPQSGSPGQTFPIGGQVSWQQSQSPLTSSPSMQQPGKTASTSTVITTSKTNNGQLSPSDQSPQSGSPGQTFPIGGQVSWQQSQSPLISSPSIQQPGKTASTSTVITTSNTNNGQFSPSDQSPQSGSPGQTSPIGGQVSWQQSQSPLISSPSIQQPGKTASTSTVITTSNTNNGQFSPSDQSPQSGSPGKTFPIGGQVSWQQSQSSLTSSPSMQQPGKTASTSTVITTSNTNNGQFSPSDQSPQSGSPGQTFPIGGQVSWQQSQSPLTSSPSMQQPGNTASTSTVFTSSNTINGQFTPSAQSPQSGQSWQLTNGAGQTGSSQTTTTQYTTTSNGGVVMGSAPQNGQNQYTMTINGVQYDFTKKLEGFASLDEQSKQAVWALCVKGLLSPQNVKIVYGSNGRADVQYTGAIPTELRKYYTVQGFDLLGIRNSGLISTVLASIGNILGGIFSYQRSPTITQVTGHSSPVHSGLLGLL